ncbi:Uu.00g061350.m01.CDS01 [Anthostomella pinea]|uniref:Uu.00g061350.m01.CDS01 n=1 Tax=Anthostomella pinea TaxID=933095 RepID=A0AAI8YMN5_9PEZI|nr:Uu.00g061350.m01.CDS01 [Anthostomella pinea]
MDERLTNEELRNRCLVGLEHEVIPLPEQTYHAIDDIERIVTLPHEAAHRDVDEVVLTANEAGGVRTLTPRPRDLRMHDFFIEHWTTGPHDEDVELSVRCFGSVFHLVISPKYIKAPELVKRHLESLHDLDTRDGSEVARQLTQPFESLMTSLAPEGPDTAGYLLSDYLYPQHFLLRAAANAEDTQITPRLSKRTSGTAPGDYILPRPRRAGFHQVGLGQSLGELQLEEWVPNIYSSDQIRLVPSAWSLENDVRLSGPTKVIAPDGTPYFFKRWCRFGNGPGASFRELATYRAIQEATTSGKLRRDLRISRLHGVVVDTDVETHPRFSDSPQSSDKASLGQGRQRLVGILLTFVDTNKPKWLGTLSDRVCCKDGKPTSALLSRWARELDECVAALHGADIIWGDVKPQNVLVDREDNIWATDFGGSHTVGWVDKEKRETIDGDLQGVERIKHFLESAAV